MKNYRDEWKEVYWYFVLAGLDEVHIADVMHGK